HLHRGKWYDYPNKNHELSDSDVQNNRAGPKGGVMFLAASGRHWTPTGTEGQFDIYHAGTRVCHVHFDCPHMHMHNSFTISGVNPEYAVEQTGAKLNRGPLGNVNIKVVKIHDGQ
ncbi:aegerolysin type hemolysin, partial [Copromyces sp. CBS 386.78]